MNSKIILSKGIKMDRNYNNVLNYTENQLLTLMQDNSHLVAYSNSYSFINKENRNSIFVKFSYNQCLQANYIAFQNPDYSNKWFFAWIDDVIFKGSTNGCEITFTIDSWSTWFSNVTPKTCFVVREHVNDDTIGLNTIPEDLNIGEVIEEQESIDSSYTKENGYFVAVATNWRPKENAGSGGDQFAGVTGYTGTIFGHDIILIKITQMSDLANLALLIIRTNYDGHINDIENIFIVPNAVINENTLTLHTATIGGQTFTYYTMPYSMEIIRFNTPINKRASFTGITIKNNKCFCYPYNYLLVTNNQGSQNIYKYEDFNSSNCIFENQISLSVGCSGRIVPKNYKNAIDNIDEALPLGKYPTCAWSSDAYINWLTQNAVNISVSLALLAGGIAAGAVTFGAGAAAAAAAAKAAPSAIPLIASSTVSIASATGEKIGAFNKAELLPNITGGTATGDISWNSDSNHFVFREMRVKNEYIKIIDDYFSRFGYKVNILKIPNITGRAYWNYIEIGGSEEIGYGEIPTKHMEIINNACRKGVTIWHNHENIGNYNLNNTIVT